jgi:enoyl-CoA hydratase
MPIHYTCADHIVTITIDRPERKNAMDMDHFTGLADSWRRFRDDPDAWVAIITGVGSAFCTGADLKTFIPQVTGQLPKPENWKPENGVHAVLKDFELFKPIIAAVNGDCVAGGMEMLGGIDIRIATPNARFGVLEPKRGLFAGGGTTARLPRQIPFPAAMEFLLTADLISAEQALAMGLLNRVVPPDELMPTALDFARRITANAPRAVQATKESVLQGLAMELPQAFQNERRLAGVVFGTEDAKEGPRAFAEKRPPRWQGK